jgi:hypothetical protein
MTADAAVGIAVTRLALISSITVNRILMIFPFTVFTPFHMMAVFISNQPRSHELIAKVIIAILMPLVISCQ